MCFKQTKINSQNDLFTDTHQDSYNWKFAKQKSLKLKFLTLKEEHQDLVTSPPSVQGEPECGEDNHDTDCQDDPVNFLLSSKGIGSI